MRLVIRRSREGRGADTSYILACHLEVTAKERERLDATPWPQWLRSLVEHGIDRDRLMGPGYRGAFANVWEAQEQEQFLRDSFAHLLAYLADAEAYGGDDVVEADLGDLN